MAPTELRKKDIAERALVRLPHRLPAIVCLFDCLLALVCLSDRPLVLVYLSGSLWL